MDGLELAREICSLRPEQKILLCTGLGDDVGGSRERPGCVAGFISKPVEVQALSVLIRQTLS